MTGKVMSSTGQALNGAIASADSAPAASAMAARFQPHERMMARPMVRSWPAVLTANRQAADMGHEIAPQGLDFFSGFASDEVLADHRADVVETGARIGDEGIV